MLHVSSVSDNAYAQRRKQFLSLVQRLRAIGAQTELDLPRIAVIGNQSAGKSSLVEAISGIRVPRDAGTCTRCPVECRLSSSSEAWSCQVYIRWEFDVNGERNNDIHEVAFGGIITEEGDVELMIRRAQAAVLNQAEDPGRYLTMSIEEIEEESRDQEPTLFSQNIVCINLSGPELTDLAFVDLPGIIQNADGRTVQLVEQLVRSHIQGNCLILVTLPMSDDIENQKALRLAKEVDPSGVRTIGVMTKPDTIPAGSIKAKELWLDILEGRRHHLQHGYFCTRQPDDDERRAGITATEARKAELDFFQRTYPWSSSNPERFGTMKLVERLSVLLMDVIDAVLPKLQDVVEVKLKDCTSELDKLPPPVTGEFTNYVMKLASSFCSDVKSHIQGTPASASLVQQNSQTYKAFKDSIRATSPKFIPYVMQKESWWEIVDGLDSEDEDALEPTPQEVFRAHQGMHDSTASAMDLQDMKCHIEKSVTRELPNNVPYTAKMVLIQSFQKTWEAEAMRCLDSVHHNFSKVIFSLSKTQFGRFQRLHARIDSCMAELVSERRHAAVIFMKTLLQLEMTPYTQNTLDLAKANAKVLSRYKEKRTIRPTSSGIAPQTTFSSVLAGSQAKKMFQDTSISFAPSQAAGKPLFSFAKTTSVIEPQPKASSGERLFEKQASTGDTSSLQSGTAFTSFAFGSKAESLQSKTKNLAENSDIAKSPAQPARETTWAELPQPQGNLPARSSPAAAPSDERQKLEVDALAALAKLGFTGITADDLNKLIPPDEFEEELKVMAEVRAFFSISYKRIVDYVPLAIDHVLLFAFTENLQESLLSRLGLGSPDASERCATYLVEDFYIASTRKNLLATKRRLESVQTELLNFSL